MYYRLGAIWLIYIHIWGLKRRLKISMISECVSMWVTRMAPTTGWGRGGRSRCQLLDILYQLQAIRDQESDSILVSLPRSRGAHGLDVETCYLLGVQKITTMYVVVSL
jgi:hypothetical protein